MISFHVSFLVGPVLAGAVTATAGLRVCYLVDAVSFGAALYGVAGLPAMAPEDGEARPGFRAVAEGLRDGMLLAGLAGLDEAFRSCGLPLG